MTLYLLLPVVALLVGGWLAFIRPPGPVLRSALQHFAAGVVFAVVAVELLPDMTHDHEPVAVAFGFLVGVALMLGLSSLLKEDANSDAPGSPLGLMLAVAIDIGIDGLLLGIGFAVGTTSAAGGASKEGKLLAIGLTLELLSLGIATAIELVRTGLSRAKSIACLILLALVFIATALIGDFFLDNFVGFWKDFTLSFGAAALLYLVTEELLAEAHASGETPIACAQFFTGFLALLLMSMFGG